MAKEKAKTGFNKEMEVSDKLAAVVGGKPKSRGKVTKKLWAYIKDKDLQEPSDKRLINCDNKLEALFGKAIQKKREMKIGKKTAKIKAGQVHMMELGGLLGKHLS
jgi:chromatin remodeling complex protein RSC6